MRQAIHVYCGPTISAAEAAGIVPGAVTHPPVQHGDLLRLDPGPGLTVVIIDGAWHQVPAVRHREILWLLAHQAVVAGAASMGALRAAELHPWGMTGVGDIYRAYRDGILTGDDEVAVAMAPGDYRPLSVAMADVTDALAQAVADGTLGQAEADALADRARSVHYADRTWEAITAAAARPGLQAAASRFGRWRADRGAGLVLAKLRDARQALHMAAAGTLPRPGPVTWSATPWGSAHLQDWLAACRGTDVGGVHVTFRDILAHQQIYDPAFPWRWRQHVLSWIARSGGPAAGGALAVARAAGLDVRHLSPAHAGYWLTPAEIAGLDDEEKLARILTRAVPQDLTALVWPVTAEQAGGLISPAAGSPRAVAAAARLNEEVSRTGPHRAICDLKTSVIRAHLAATWAVSAGDAAELTAAARDRGFGTAAAAVAAARPFFLLASAVVPAGRATG